MSMLVGLNDIFVHLFQPDLLDFGREVDVEFFMVNCPGKRVNVSRDPAKAGVMWDWLVFLDSCLSEDDIINVN